LDKAPDINRLYNTIKDHEIRISKLESLVRKEPIKIEGKNIKSFIKNINPQSDVKLTLAIGYYLEKYEGFSSFNAKDLEKGYLEAREPLPPNIHDKIQLNVRNEHFMESPEKKDNFKAYFLTNSGERYVENHFEE